MTLIGDALIGFRAVLIGLIPNTTIFYEDDDIDLTGKAKYIKIKESHSTESAGVGGDKKWNLNFILDCYFKSGSDKNINYKAQAEDWFFSIVEAIEKRTTFDLFLQNSSIKFGDIYSNDAYPFEAEKPGKFKRIISLKGYIINTTTYP